MIAPLLPHCLFTLKRFPLAFVWVAGLWVLSPTIYGCVSSISFDLEGGGCSAPANRFSLVSTVNYAIFAAFVVFYLGCKGDPCDNKGRPSVVHFIKRHKGFAAGVIMFVGACMAALLTNNNNAAEQFMFASCVLWCVAPYLYRHVPVAHMMNYMMHVGIRIGVRVFLMALITFPIGLAFALGHSGLYVVILTIFLIIAIPWISAGAIPRDLSAIPLHTRLWHKIGYALFMVWLTYLVFEPVLHDIFGDVIERRMTPSGRAMFFQQRLETGIHSLALWISMFLLAPPSLMRMHGLRIKAGFFLAALPLWLHAIDCAFIYGRYTIINQRHIYISEGNIISQTDTYPWFHYFDVSDISLLLWLLWCHIFLWLIACKNHLPLLKLAIYSASLMFFLTGVISFVE